MASEATAKRISDKGADAPAAKSAPEAEVPLFAPLRDLDNRGKVVIAALILLANIPLIHYFFRHVLREMPTTTAVPFQDNFDRDDVGPNYWSTGADWRIENGELHAPWVKDNPLWLQAKLPDDVAIDFDAHATQEGDIKFEVFGDGLNHSSGYIVELGGWNNQLTAIHKLDDRHALAFDARGIGLQAPPNEAAQAAVSGRSLSELFNNHTLGPDTAWRVQRNDIRVQAGVGYHFHFERKGGDIKWYVNNQLVLEVNDAFPLKGKGHDRFGFSGWEADAWFDNLSIQPL